tara:strand:- start:65 stop:358 length:294 start_codon:yes stop_codon:yes gene_type:complete
MIQELRIYRLHPGKLNAFLVQFKKAKHFMKKYGVTFEDAWINPDRKDEFVWMRSFTSTKARDKAIEAYYSSPEWLAIVDRIRPLIKRREVRLLKRSR